eukprot:1589721-Prymnesium_polylepis.1
MDANLSLRTSSSVWTTGSGGGAASITADLSWAQHESIERRTSSREAPCARQQAGHNCTPVQQSSLQRLGTYMWPMADVVAKG